ncbi:hypothetical protein ACQPW3_38810 [Actinosynnema sp. CA-248983]
MTADPNRPWTDDELIDGFSLSVGDERFDRFLREIREWWERQPRTALRTIPRAARRLGVTRDQMRDILYLSGTRLGHSLKSPDYCRQHGPMQEVDIRDALRHHCTGCKVRTDAARKLSREYVAGESLLALAVLYRIGPSTVRAVLVEIGTTIRPSGRPPNPTNANRMTTP